MPLASTNDAGNELKTVKFLLMLKLVTVRGNRWEEEWLVGFFSFIWQLSPLVNQQAAKQKLWPGLALKRCWQAENSYLPIELNKLCSSISLCLYKQGLIVCDLQTSLQAEQLSDIQLTVGAAVVVSHLPSCRGLAVPAGSFFEIASLSLSFEGLSLSEDRETKAEEEEE